MTRKKSITIIIPVYNEAESLIILYREIRAVVRKNKINYQLIFVNDGSQDQTAKVIKKISSLDSKVLGINFWRNFGKSAALQAGINQAQHPVIITLDADLQDDPQEIPRLLKEMERGFDLVCSWKINRRDPFFKRLLSLIFNRIVGFVGNVHLHDMNSGLKAMTKDVALSLQLYGELHRYIPFFAKFYGFTITEIPVHHRPRRFGYSKYGFARIIHGFFDLFTVIYLTQFQSRPMHIFGSMGAVLTFLGILLGTYLTVEKLIFLEKIGHRPLLTLAILLIILGVQVGTFGLLAEQITLAQAKEQRSSFIKNKVAKGKEIKKRG